MFYKKTLNYCIIESCAPETVALTGDGGNLATRLRNTRIVPLGMVRVENGPLNESIKNYCARVAKN